MDQEPVTFRALEERDFELLHRWFNAPHARRWFGHETSLEEIAEEYLPVVRRDLEISAFIAEIAGSPVGMMEWTLFGTERWLQEAYRVQDPNTANCDVIVGEGSDTDRGLGPMMVEAFLREHIFADSRVQSCLIDPETDNAIAIRAYEKVGFRFVRAMAEDGEGHSVYLMQLTRAEFERSAPGDHYAGVIVRPARVSEFSLCTEIDDEACMLYAQVGLTINADDGEAFFANEQAHWQAAIEQGRVLFACASDGEVVGFCALGEIDGAGWLQQVAVRRDWMRKGIGRALLRRAKRWSVRRGALWLTTWDGVAWNAPWYAREGFVAAKNGTELGAGIASTLAEERRVLPSPERRVAMVYRHRDGVEY